MDEYFEQLAKGSPYHRVERGLHSMRISAIEEVDPTRRHFKVIAEEAEIFAANAGYRCTPHISSMDSHGLDSLTIEFGE